MKKLVSVIIPTFKGAEKLSRAIDSIINQTYESIEIIVVDDNEPLSIARKQTEDVINKYININVNINYIKHEKNKNGAAARNTGLFHAKGDYICFLDDDDFYLPNRIERSVNILLSNKVYDAVYCGVILMNNNEFCKVISADKILSQKDILLNENVIGTGSNIFMTRKVIDKLEGFDESFTRHQDVEFMLRLLKQFDVINLSEMLIIKGTNGTSNIPKYEAFKKVKNVFFNKFEKEINNLNQQEKYKFYCKQYETLLYSAILSQDRTYIKESIANLKKYRELYIKERILIFLVITRLYSPYKFLSKRYHLLKPSKIQMDKYVSEKDLEYILQII